MKRIAGKDEHGKLRSFKESGIKVCGPDIVVKSAAKAGLQATVKWVNHALPGSKLAKIKVELGSLTAKNWIAQVTR